MNSIEPVYRKDSSETGASEAKSPPGVWRWRLQSLAICLLMVPVWFLIFEGALWLAGWEPRTPLELMAFLNPEWRDEQVFQLDPDLFWRFRPNQMVMNTHEEYGEYEIQVNHLGFQESGFPDPRAEESFRIMFLGDSCIFGWDVPQKMNFPSRLLEALQQKTPRRHYHAFIGGIPGYTSFQAKRVLDLYGAEYRPDFVVIYLGTNDAIPCVHLPDAELMDYIKQQWERASLLQKSRLYRLAEQLLRKPEQETQSLLEIARSLDHQNGPFRVALDCFEANLREIVQVSREQFGAQVLFLTRQDLRSQFRITLYNDRVRQLGQQLEVPVVDVADWFASQPDPESLYIRPERDKVHPNEKGYQAIANLVVEAIVRHGLIPGLEGEERMQ